MANSEPQLEGPDFAGFEDHLRKLHAGGWSPESIPGKNANSEMDRFLAAVRAQAVREAAQAWHAENSGTSPRAYQWLWERAEAIEQGVAL